MKKPKLLSVIAVLVAAFALLLILALQIRQDLLLKSEYSAQNRDHFTCYSYDPDGHLLEGYHSEKDGVWYLFLTSAQSVEETTLYASGGITQTTQGKLDKENGVIRGAFTQNGDRVELTDAGGTTYTVVALQSDLPSVYIDLEGTTLEQIHNDRKVQYDSTSVYITDPAGEHSLAVRNNVQIKGRGNSSWRYYEKRGYQIRFDTKTSVMGMPEAKKWVLLASAGDDSLMRFQLASRAAQSWDMAFVPKFQFVDLWIEGEYRGTYLLGEKVEIGENRLNLKNAQGALFEHDEDFYLDEENWFVSDYLSRHFTLKEKVVKEDALIPSIISDFDCGVEELMIYLYSTPSEQVTLETLSKYIDVDSFAKYYLLNEYMQNNESFSTSFYWYQDGPEDVLHLGPVWDFDSCMGTDGKLPTDQYGHEHPLFQYLLAAPAFYERTQQLMEQYGASLFGMTEDVAVLKAQLERSAYMNYCRWDALGKANPKGGVDLAPTFDEATENLQAWLQAREEGFHVPSIRTISSNVSVDCRELELRVMPETDCDSVIFSVWSWDNEQDDIRWYPAERKPDGSWQATVDLSNHNCAGIYCFGAYTDNQSRLLADGSTYVEVAVEPRFPMEVRFGQDNQTMQIAMTDVEGTLRAVRFAIWGQMDQEGTLVWKTADLSENGRWEIQLPVRELNLSGPETVIIHAYGINTAGEDAFVSESFVEIS